MYILMQYIHVFSNISGPSAIDFKNISGPNNTNKPYNMIEIKDKKTWR